MHINNVYFLQDMIKIIAMGKVFFKHKIEVSNCHFYNMITKVNINIRKLQCFYECFSSIYVNTAKYMT